MARRERISSHIECKDCGKTGTAEWSENENPVHGRGLDSQLLSVTEGFAKGQGTVALGDQAIVCLTCDKVVNDASAL
jgi:hypothetical protein